jgi:hypothetical protein
VQVVAIRHGEVLQQWRGLVLMVSFPEANDPDFVEFIAHVDVVGSEVTMGISIAMESVDGHHKQLQNVHSMPLEYLLLRHECSQRDTDRFYLDHKSIIGSLQLEVVGEDAGDVVLQSLESG